MRSFAIFIAALPLAFAETSLFTTQQCYSRYDKALGETTVYETGVPTTRYRTETHIIARQPIVFAAQDAAAATTKSTTTHKTHHYTKTIPPPAGFTPIKKSKHLPGNTKLRRRAHVIPRTPRKQQTRAAGALNYVKCREQVEHVEIVRHTTTDAATATYTEGAAAAGGLAARAGTYTYLTTTFAAPAATYYPACGDSNRLSRLNDTGVSYLTSPSWNNLAFVDAVDVYSCCVACFERAAEFPCGGYAFGGRNDGGDGRDCRIYGSANATASPWASPHPSGAQCEPDTLSWGFYTGYSSVWSGPFEIGNGPCAQTTYSGAAPSYSS